MFFKAKKNKKIVFLSIKKYKMHQNPIKLVFLGDSGVGKTSIINMRCHNSFDVETPPTIGSTSFSLEVNVWGKTILLSIWDTAGQERYQSIVSLFLRNVKIAIIVASIVDNNSISNIDIWINLLQQYDDKIPFIIAINKIDLISDINNKKFNELKEKFLLKYKTIIFISALIGTNLIELFEIATKEYLKLNENSIKKIENTLQNNNNNNNCC